MRPEWQAENLQIAFREFLRQVDNSIYEPFGTTLEEAARSSYLLYAYFAFEPHGQCFFVSFDRNGLVYSTSNTTNELDSVKLASLPGLQPFTSIWDFVPEVIAAIARECGAPDELKLSFTYNQIVHGVELDGGCTVFVSDLLKMAKASKGSSLPLINSVSKFTTRWELVVDLFESLSELQLDIVIADEPEDADVVKVHLAEQGIDLHDEHQCYVYILGMCNMVEAMFTSFNNGNLPRDELVSTIGRMLGILAHIRQFLPQEIFTRFLT